MTSLRLTTFLTLTGIALAGCYSGDQRLVEDNSSQAILQEYRSFLADTAPDLGLVAPGPTGQLEPVARSVPAGNAVPVPPPPTEQVAAGSTGVGGWWDEQVSLPLPEENNRTVALTVGEMFSRALANSNQIKVFADLPLIRDTAISEAEGRFDPRLFAEGEYRSLSEPVGSTLQTGGAGRFEEDEFSLEAGVKQQIITGGEVTLSQRLGYTDSNSSYFIPEDQASTELQLSIRQPLLQGFGFDYTLAAVRIATIDRNIAVAEFQRQVEQHLLESVRNYWTLYYLRAYLLQQERLVAETGRVLGELRARSAIDVLPSDIAQANAALAKQRAQLVRIRAGIDDAEARLATLLSDAGLAASGTEILPAQVPVTTFVGTALEDVGALAIENRPEVRQVVGQLQAAVLRREVAESDLLPTLDLIARTYVSGLSGDYDTTDAFGNQFDEGRPSFAVGFYFEIPLDNTTDEAVYTRRRLEIRQLENQVRTTTETVLLEAQVAVREVRTAYNEMMANKDSMEAADREVRSLRARGLGGGSESGSAFLNTLLDSLEERAAAEEAYMRSVVAYNVALFTVERAAGTLLSVRDVSAHRIEPKTDEELEQIIVTTPATGVPDGAGVDILTDPEGTRAAE